MHDRYSYGHRVDDLGLNAVHRELVRLDPDGTRVAAALRRTFDMLLDSPNTGRHRWEQLHKIEQAGCGAVVAINLQREFAFADGKHLDYRIAENEVACVYVHETGECTVRPEALGGLCLVLSANDNKGRWSADLVRAGLERLPSDLGEHHPSALTSDGLTRFHWSFHHARLPPNEPQHLAGADRTRRT